MAEMNKGLKFWMSGEIQSDVGYAHLEARNLIEDQVNQHIRKKYYGDGLREWSFISIILNEETDLYYPEIKRYRKKKREVEFRLKINHKEFLEGDNKIHLKLIAQSLIRSMDIMKDMRIEDFDINSLNVDVTQCLSKFL